MGACFSPSFVRGPEGNGRAERFIRTLKERFLWGRTFETVEELRQALLEWAHRYIAHWLLERHDFLSPSQARRVPRPLRVAVRTGEGKAGLGAPGEDH